MMSLCLVRTSTFILMLQQLLCGRCGAWSFMWRRKVPVLPSKNNALQQRMRVAVPPFSYASQLYNSGSTSSEPIVPITVLSGFLGSGKTTLLKYMLGNNEGLRIAVIVNDVASVNIDSKLVRGQSASEDQMTPASPAGIVELQNGCACCSLSGELLTSVSELITLTDLRNDEEKFDHIVIEMSGVAEPRSVRNIFQEAIMYDMPLMERVKLDTLVTVVDCSSYLEYIRSSKVANSDESPELFYRDETERMKAKEEGDELWLNPFSLASDFQGGVCDLLVEQTEVADVILLNKLDLVDGNLNEVKETIAALNPRAKVLATSFGKIDTLKEILAYSKGEGVALDGVVDDHKDYVNAADESNCSDPECTNPLHSHGHSSHTHHHEKHSDIVQQSTVCNDPECGDHTHSHSHASDDIQSTICNDPDCHDHSHSHSHASNESKTHAGIGSFVYRARRPFHPTRIVSLIRKLPIVRGLSSDDKVHQDLGLNKESINALQQVIRSKGFTWTADSNVKALYWSHAGTSFEMQCLGRWWSTLPRSQWPEEAKESILADFDCSDHDELASSTTVGDRRQEIVFIGPGLASPKTQQIIKDALNLCLLDDDEWYTYCSERTDESALSLRFENTLPTRMLTTN
jgi:G3E family GTPase